MHKSLKPASVVLFLWALARSPCLLNLGWREVKEDLTARVNVWTDLNRP